MAAAARGGSLRRHATTIALVLAAAAVATYAWIDRGSVSESERAMRPANLFPAWRRDDVSRVELATPREAIVLERTRDDAGDRAWRMRSPRDEPADAAAVDKLVTALEMATPVRKVSGDAIAASGVDAPRVRGTIRMGSLEYRFALGRDAPTPAGAAYLRLDGDAGRGVFVVSKELAAQILAPADAYRTRAIVPYLSVELSRLEVTTASGGFTIERGDDVSFRLASGLRASRDKLDDVWGALGETRAEAFLDDAEADRATASPVVTVRMTPTDGRPRGELLIGGACPGHPEDVVVVRRAPTRLSACAPKGILPGLETDAASLVDARLFAAHDDEITELRLAIVPAGAALDLARKESGWHERAPADRDLPPDEVDAATALAATIARARGEGPRRDAAPFEARARVTIARADGATEAIELNAARAANGDVMARRAFDGAVLHLDPATARALLPRATALRPRVLWTPPIDLGAVTALETSCGDVAQTIAREGDGWVVRAPPGFGAADGAATVNTIDALLRAKPDAWVADADDGTFGLDAPCTVTLRVRQDAGEGARALQLGADGEGGTYARASGDPAVMLLPKGTRELARTWLLARPALPFERVGDGVTAIVRAGAIVRRVTAAPDDATAGDAAPSPDGGADLWDALQRVRLDPAVHPGAARADEGFAAPHLTIELTGAVTARLRVGAKVARDGVDGRFARVDGVDATFFVPSERVDPLLRAIGAASPSPPDRDR